MKRNTHEYIEEDKNGKQEGRQGDNQTEGPTEIEQGNKVRHLHQCKQEQ